MSYIVRVRIINLIYLTVFFVDGHHLKLDSVYRIEFLGEFLEKPRRPFLEKIWDHIKYAGTFLVTSYLNLK